MILFSYEEYDDDKDSSYEDSSYVWDDFKDNTKYELDHLSYPLTLEARNSNWRGQTGYAEVNDFDDLIGKVASFDSSFVELHKEDDEYYFRLATHDVPTGFCIYITQGEE